MNKGLMILAPVSVVIFVAILAVMYGWVGSVCPVTEEGFIPPESNTVAANTPLPDEPVFPMGLGDNTMQLINDPVIPTGIGNNTMQLVNDPAVPMGIGNNTMQLVNDPAISMGLGNNTMQLVNDPAIPLGIGNSQIQLAAKRLPPSPYLGVELSEVPEAISASLKLPPETGALIRQVLVGSPCDTAGLKTGDIIVSIKKKPVTGRESVGVLIRPMKVGSVVKMLVNRNGRKKSFHVTLGEKPGNTRFIAAVTAKKIWVGADLQDVDAVMKQQFGLPDNRGVIVSHISKNSPAEKAGLRTGDVIRRFGGTRIRDLKQLHKKILGLSPGEKVQLTVFRNGDNTALRLKMGEVTPKKEKVPFLGPADIAIEGTWIGMDVGELSANGAADMGLPPGTRGILVNDVESPPATMVGFQTGDVIVGVNGLTTPDMKHFEDATKMQTQAVVDVIRGNKHMFISVPRSGYTVQGTRINTGMNRSMKQVAQITPASGKLGILSQGSQLTSPVAGNLTMVPYIILVNLDTNSFSVIEPERAANLTAIVDQYGIDQVVCGNLSRYQVSALKAKGVSIYSGVVGNVNNAISLYESGHLVSMRAM